MTHEELLKTLSGEEPIYVRDILYSALRAVVELHKEYSTSDGLKFCVICTRTEDIWEYPCQTIQAIEKELK